MHKQTKQTHAKGQVRLMKMRQLVGKTNAKATITKATITTTITRVTSSSSHPHTHLHRDAHPRRARLSETSAHLSRNKAGLIVNCNNPQEELNRLARDVCVTRGDEKDADRWRQREGEMLLLLLLGGITSTLETFVRDAVQQRAAMIAKHRREEGNVVPFVRHLVCL